MDATAFTQGWLTGDPFLSGDLGADQLGLMYPALRGVQQPDLAGPVVLYRRKIYPGDVEDWYIAGLAGPGASTIQNGDGITHAVSAGYQYAAARMFGNGFQGELSPPVQVNFDGAGDIISPALPVWPRELNAIPRAGGTFELTWVYLPWGEGTSPTDFQVFEGSTIGGIDYGSAIATVAFNPMASVQRHTTGAFGDGTPHAFAVRARNSGGVAELNELTTEVINAEDGTPAAATIGSARVASPGG